VGGVLLDQVGILAVYRLSASVTLLALLVFVVGLRRYGQPDTPALQALAERSSEP